MSTQNKQILIVDDDADQLFIARALLEREGYSVLTHPSPYGAAELIEAASPDLVLLDLDMPSMPGDVLAGLLRTDHRTSHVPIMLFSAANETRLMWAVVLHRLEGYIVKREPADLLAKVAGLLDTCSSDHALPVRA